MKKRTLNVTQIYNVFLWEFKQRFYSLRYPCSIFLGLLFLLHVLPQSVFQYLNTHAYFLISIITILLFLAISFGMLIIPFYYLTKPYGTNEYLKEKTSDVSTKLRLFTRISVNFIQNGILLLFAYMAMWETEKLGNNNHEFLILQPAYSFGYALFTNGFFAPMVYLTFFLRRYSIFHEKNYVFSAIIAIIFSTILLPEMNELQKSFTGIPQPLFYFLCILVILLLTSYFFLRCCHYEEQL